MNLHRTDLFFEVERVRSGVVRLDNDFFPVEDEHLIATHQGVTIDLPMENGALLVVAVMPLHARAVLFRRDLVPCGVTAGRIVPSGIDMAPIWTEVVRSTDDLRQWLRQFGGMEVECDSGGMSSSAGSSASSGGTPDASTLWEFCHPPPIG